MCFDSRSEGGWQTLTFVGWYHIFIFYMLNCIDGSISVKVAHYVAAIYPSTNSNNCVTLTQTRIIPMNRGLNGFEFRKPRKWSLRALHMFKWTFLMVYFLISSLFSSFTSIISFASCPKLIITLIIFSTFVFSGL
jgi:hypothetical protein